MLTEISRKGSLSPRASYTGTKDFKKRDKRGEKKIMTRTEKNCNKTGQSFSVPFAAEKNLTKKPIKITDTISDGI
jgi:hypothetical protein